MKSKIVTIFLTIRTSFEMDVVRAVPRLDGPPWERNKFGAPMFDP